MEYRLQLKELYDSEDWFRDFIKQARESKPDTPRFKPSDDNTDQWKHDSGIIVGYELLLNKIDPYGGN